MKNASLVLVGSGIKFLSHLTTEAKAYIEQSDKVLYLVNEPAMKEWIQNNASQAESLDSLYVKHPLRLHCYRAITQHILATLKENKHVCVVLYGHPTVFAQPGLAAVQQAQKAGYYTKILPGISAEACLFADLMINPGLCGYQSFEATDFLIHHRQFDPSSHLLLWQVGMIGVLNHPLAHDNEKGAKLLCHYLKQYYPSTHEVILYEAAQYPHFEPNISKITLIELPAAPSSGVTTLYVPPARKALCDKVMLSELGINITDLQ
jgi:tetrapyrrole methylase family protein/MazG family protein